ncbi:MAG: GTPase HflX, partial [Spirochaetaceae bacterium]|nr:GTPase HflX [Spirochaetaceae bacterium]
MISSTDNLPKPERALLVGIEGDKIDAKETKSLLYELGGLAKTLGLEVADQITVKLREKTANLLVGSGKADEITAIAKSLDVDSVIFDFPLSPVQQRNLETLSGKKVYDRSELILKIFSQRAMTKEASLQIELASLKYSLPRLAHSYDDLSRQRGGRYGTKGSGEQKIELDRRSIEKRIHDIEDELEKVKKSRSVQRKRRERIELPRAALVGYTNVGKSSLLNAITQANALAEDKLFATLDPMTRRLSLSSGANLLVTDTVGFVRNLPHGLIEAFNATLEEAANADILIHVADASDQETVIHMATTEKVLSEIGAGLVPRIQVLNKIDIADPCVVEAWQRVYPDGILVSAVTGAGIRELSVKIEQSLT